jgi:hypothetical protein
VNYVIRETQFVNYVIRETQFVNYVIRETHFMNYVIRETQFVNYAIREAHFVNYVIRDTICKLCHKSDIIYELLCMEDNSMGITKIVNCSVCEISRKE